MNQKLQSVIRKITDKKKRNKWILYISIASLVVLFNIIAWNSTAFCDAYIAYVFPVWVNTYGRFSGLFPFSLGEWMLLTGVILVLLAILGLIPGSILFLCKSRLCKYFRRYYIFFAWTVLAVCVVMTLNCSILYHASGFSQKYFQTTQEDYTLEELIVLYNHVVTRCNSLSQQMERDLEGAVVYSGSVNKDGKNVDMEDKAIETMQQLGKTYPQLDGFYPRPKKLLSSDFMCQQYMCGYYFPFSMEANYNDVMFVMNKPATLCHELAHLRGYIYEDEANFISYLACIQSDDAVFQYAGYLSVLNYLGNDLYRAYQKNPEVYRAAIANVEPVAVLPVVIEDNIFVTQEEWDRIHKKAIFDTETVNKVSDSFTDATLKLNGVSDGMISYSRVVKLMLQYYRESGYGY